MTYIKILTALTALALLTACGSPTVNIGEVNINNGALCDTNPYGANCGEEFETPRQTIASGCRTDDSGALCEDATTFVCDKNFDDMLCDDITEYVDQREVVMEQCTDTKTQKACDEEDRITACDANEFATDCAEQKYVDKRRMTCTGDKTSTRCMPTVELICGEDGDIFDDFCTGLPDTDTMRANACQTHGTDAGGDDSCAASLASSCTITDPFIYTGCKDVEGIAGVRMMYCQTPANAWDAECMDTTHGAVDDTRMTACQMFGTDMDTGGHATCATSLAIVCNDIANPFIYKGCDDVAGINAGVRKIFCETPATAWNPKCMDTTHGAVDATRVTACEMFGTDTGMGGDDSCANSLISVCLLANPFIHAGCDDVAGIDDGVRTMFCEMPANAWNPKCMDGMHGAVTTTRVTACQMFGTGMGGDDSCATSLISVCLLANPFIHEGCNDVVGIDAGLRKTFCETPANAWNPKCMETTHGTVIATRMTACQMFGTGTGGDNSCAASLASVCNDIANPFIHAGCDDVAGIDAGVRTMYCQMSANAWNPKCMDTTHGTVTATRGDACLEFGTDTTRGGHRSCVSNTLAESSCASNPFDPANPGCAILTKFEMIVRTYCKASHLAGCPTATYDAWVASFPQNAPLLASNLAPTAGNKFLQGKETGLNTTGLRDFTADSFNFQTATYNGMLFGGSPTNGVAFQYGNIGGKRYFYAGLLSGTDLGPPLTEAVTNATWYGRIVVLQNRDWYLTRAGKIYGDIDLTVNYDGDNNGTIRGSYGEYTVNGTFDSKGIMGGNVTRSKIDTYTRRTFIGDSNATTTTTYSFQRRVVGPLTGLIGQTEAVGVFIGQDFTNYDDKPRQVDANLNNFKHPATRAGFAGGFIARSTRP